MSMFTSFLGGFATQAVASMEQEEKDARAIAAAQTKAMYENYAKVKEENRKLADGLKENISIIKAYAPNATEDQLFETAKDPAAMSALTQAIKDKTLDPSSFDINQFVTVIKGNESSASALDRVNQLVALPKLAKKKEEESAQASQAEGLGFSLNKLLKPDLAKATRGQAERTALAYGKTLDELQAASEYVKPEMTSNAKFDMSVLNRPDFANRKNKVLNDLADAQQSGDPVKIDAAVKSASAIKAAELTLAVDKNMTEADIQTGLITRINASKDPREKSALISELRTRQQLQKLPGEGGEKVSQANLLAVAKGTVNSALAYSLPPGSFNVDAQGNMVPKDLSSAKEYRKGYKIGLEAAIDQMTTNGVPKGQMEKNALLSVGVRFDQQGKAVVPEELNAPAAPAKSLPKGSKTETPAAAAATSNPEADRAYAAIKAGKDPAAVRAKYKELTGKELP